MDNYLIIGGTGSLGKKLISRLLEKPGVLVSIMSRDEAKSWTIKNEYASDPNVSRLRFFVGDIRSIDRVKDVLRQVMPTKIIIAAALKQVDTCELSPSESVATNVTGTFNVVNAVNELAQSQLKAVLFVSTDKACSPINVYGMCKALSERVITSQALTSTLDTKFLVVRYGNVLESRGSIIPLFKYQVESGGPITVTDPKMTRFVMTLDDSVDLILHAFANGVSGTTWIPRLQSMRIGDLANIFSRRFKTPIKIIGLRPGEKLDEDLINEAESERTLTTSSGNHYVISPSTKIGQSQKFVYASDSDLMSEVDLESYLLKLGILNVSSSEFSGLHIEEIRKA